MSRICGELSVECREDDLLRKYISGMKDRFVHAHNIYVPYLMREMRTGDIMTTKKLKSQKKPVEIATDFPRVCRGVISTGIKKARPLVPMAQTELKILERRGNEPMGKQRLDRYVVRTKRRLLTHIRRLCYLDMQLWRRG